MILLLLFIVITRLLMASISLLKIVVQLFMLFEFVHSDNNVVPKNSLVPSLNFLL